MRLRALLASLSSLEHNLLTYIDVLEAAGLKTPEDLLFGAQTADQYRSLPHNAITLEALLELKDKVARTVGAPGLHAAELYARATQAEENRYRGETGLAGLDGLLGGFGQYGVIEVSGGKATGKSLLAIHVVLRYLALVPEGTALWIDTSNSFSAERALAVLAFHDGLGKATALDRLHVSVCFDVQPAIDVLDDIRQSIDIGMDAPSASTTRFIVIDAITQLLGPNLSNMSAQGHATMQTFLRQLSSLARSYSMTVLALNVAVSSHPYNPLSAFSPTTTKPSLGPSFTFLTDATIWLAKGADMFPEDVSVTGPGKERVYMAEVLRARDSWSRTWCAFKSNGLTLLPA